MSNTQTDRAAPKAADRPLSPFMTWRWHITMLTSILHRITGVALYGAALVLAGWALALASGPGAYDRFRLIAGSLPGKFVLIVITFALFYHLANGLRHLAWDFGSGFRLKTANATAALVITVAALATVGLWVAVGLTGGLA